MDSRKLVLVFLLLVAGCQQGPDHDYPEKPDHVQFSASVEESVPANATVVDWNGTSLSENETVKSVVETAVETNATAEEISVETYRSLRKQFRNLPHQTSQSERVTEPMVTVYVRYTGLIVRIHLRPFIPL